MPPKKRLPQSLPSPRASYKFLPRNLHVNDYNAKILQKVLVKGLYLRNLLDSREEVFSGDEEAIYRSFKNAKLLKTLKHARIPILLQRYSFESLKYSKSLQKFSIRSWNEIHMHKVPGWLKRLPPSIKKVSVEVYNQESIPDKDFYKIAKSIRYLPRLESYYRDFCLDLLRERTHVHRELKTYNEVAVRLKKLNELGYNVGIGEHNSFLKAMRKGIVCPEITELRINLTANQMAGENFVTRHFDPDKSTDDVNPKFDFDNLTPGQNLTYQAVKYESSKDEKEQRERLRSLNDEEVKLDPFYSDLFRTAKEEGIEPVVDQDLLLHCFIQERFKPFYSFDLFPNLKKLSFSQEEHKIPLFSYVIDRFAALQKLQDLMIDLGHRSIGTTNIFKGLLELPLLRSFKLHVPFIKNEEWILLQQFMRKQTNIESLDFYLQSNDTPRTRYLQQNVFLENFIKELENKKHLKYLYLTSNAWSLEALSKGLAHLTMRNQLLRFSFQGGDDTITSQEKAWKRVQGLCDFIKNQKDSLRVLWVILPCVFEETVVTHIAEAISKLTNLTDLYSAINSNIKNERDSVVKYFQETIQNDIPAKSRVKLKQSKTWNPPLAKYFKHLQNLEYLTLRFDITQSDSTNCFVDLMKVLPTLEKLRTVWIKTRSGKLLKRVEKKIVPYVEELWNIKSIRLIYSDIYDDDEDGDESFEEDEDDPEVGGELTLRQIVKKVNNRQSMRCDLMF